MMFCLLLVIIELVKILNIIVNQVKWFRNFKGSCIIKICGRMLSDNRVLALKFKGSNVCWGAMIPFA